MIVNSLDTHRYSIHFVSLENPDYYSNVSGFMFSFGPLLPNIPFFLESDTACEILVFVHGLGDLQKRQHYPYFLVIFLQSRRGLCSVQGPVASEEFFTSITFSYSCFQIFSSQFSFPEWALGHDLVMSLCQSDMGVSVGSITDRVHKIRLHRPSLARIV